MGRQEEANKVKNELLVLYAMKYGSMGRELLETVINDTNAAYSALRKSGLMCSFEEELFETFLEAMTIMKNTSEVDIDRYIEDTQEEYTKLLV